MTDADEDQRKDERFFTGDASEYSEEFLAALKEYQAGNLRGALVSFEALLAGRDDFVPDVDLLSVAAAALNRASILSLTGETEAAIAAYDSALQRFGDDDRVAALEGLAASYAHGRDHREVLARRLRNRRLAWPLAILIYGTCAAVAVGFRRRWMGRSR
jgi:tetratricopeptide (TPR) repeat protein